MDIGLVLNAHKHCVHNYMLLFLIQSNSPSQQECRKLDVQCIVAPYEADAQLAYLSKEGLVDVVITEDSDLLVFGAKRVLYKMDEFGNGKLVEIRDLGKANKNIIVSWEWRLCFSLSNLACVSTVGVYWRYL